MNLTDFLCTECGLCCDGSLFSDVELSSAKELSGLEVLGLNVEDGDRSAPGLLLQPCNAREGKRCGIYQHRPKCCRTFECRLLKDVRSGKMSANDAREKIAVVSTEMRSFRELIGINVSGLPLKEQYLEVMDSMSSQKQTAAIEEKEEELTRRMRILERMIKKTFLE